MLNQYGLLKEKKLIVFFYLSLLCDKQMIMTPRLIWITWSNLCQMLVKSWKDEIRHETASAYLSLDDWILDRLVVK